MVRQISSSKINMSRQVLTKAQGGTGVASISEAAASLHLATNALIGQANGLIPLDSNGKIPLSKFANNTKVNLAGSLVAYVGVNNWYNITDFDSNRNYNISVTAGSVSRTDSFITFTPPVTPQIVTMAINGKGYSIDVQASVPQVPVIAAPMDNSTVLTTSYNFVTNSYVAIGDAGTHEMTDWLIATDINFTNIVKSSLNDTVNKTSWTATGLVDGTGYYAAVRFKGSNSGWSGYSATKVFTIGVPAPVAPSSTYPLANATDVSLSFTWTASPFVTMPEDSTHLNTDWQIAYDTGFTNVIRSSLADSVNKTSWAMSGFTPNTQYYARVRYRCTNGKVSNWSVTQSFRTINRIAVNLVFSANTQDYVLDPAKVAGYVPGIMDVTLTVNAGVVVGASSTGVHALDVSSDWTAGDTVKVINNGYIVGAGGNGGNGCNGYGDATVEYGGGGYSGGPAFRARRATTVTNNGTIGGGGGGGAGGLLRSSYGAGGGGGAGWTGGAGGSAGYYINRGGFGTPTAGSPGSLTVGGSGGIGGQNKNSANDPATPEWSAGFPGGSLGTAGGSAYNIGLYTSSGPATGGGGGAAVIGNANITWLTTGTRLGAIS